MAEFVEVEHKDIEATAFVAKNTLAHYKKSGWKPVTKKSATKSAADKKES